MNHFRKYRESFRVLTVILVALNLIIALISYKYYMIEKRRFEQEIDHQLDNIADLKVNQVVDWRHERLSDANFLSRSQEIRANFWSLASAPENMALKTRFFNNLNAMFLNGKYEAMLAFTADGRNILSIHDTLAAIPEPMTL